MTFDFQRALGFALSARNFRPSPLPVGGIFPPTWFPPGWSTGFHMSLTFFFALAVTVTWQMPQTAAQSGRHGDGHAEMHDKYKGWSPPGNPGLSCCNDDDCRPTRAYPTEEGWRAWNGRAWLLVPADRVLPTDFAGDGRSHLCEARDHVYCFTPGQVRF